MYRFLYFLFWPLIKILLPTKVIGKKNYDKKETYLILCNHRSKFDCLLLVNNIYKRNYYLGKKELFKNKFLNFFWKKMGVVPIDRNGIDIQAIKKCLNIFKNKKSLVIFPEGTRADDEQMKQFKNGGTMLAIKGKVKILPIYFVNKPKMLKLNKIIIGEPFELSDFYESRLSHETLDSAGKIVLDKLLLTKSCCE